MSTEIEYRELRGGKCWKIVVDGREAGAVEFLASDLYHDSGLEVSWEGDDVGVYRTWAAVERVVERLAGRP